MVIRLGENGPEAEHRSVRVLYVYVDWILFSQGSNNYSLINLIFKHNYLQSPWCNAASIIFICGILYSVLFLCGFKGVCFFLILLSFVGLEPLLFVILSLCTIFRQSLIFMTQIYRVCTKLCWHQYHREASCGRTVSLRKTKDRNYSK